MRRHACSASDLATAKYEEDKVEDHPQRVSFVDRITPRLRLLNLIVTGLSPRSIFLFPLTILQSSPQMDTT
jgi:hypothetical protein